MKLSDIVSASGLSIYPMIALVLFLLAFFIVVVRLLLPGRRAQWEHAAALPLEDVNDRFGGAGIVATAPAGASGDRRGPGTSSTSTGRVAGSISGKHLNVD